MRRQLTRLRNFICRLARSQESVTAECVQPNRKVMVEHKNKTITISGDTDSVNRIINRYQSAIWTLWCCTDRVGDTIPSNYMKFVDAECQPGEVVLLCEVRSDKDALTRVLWDAMKDGVQVYEISSKT